MVTKQEYSDIFTRIVNHPELSFGDSPSNRSNRQVYHSDKQTGFYFDDDNGHILEVIKQTSS